MQRNILGLYLIKLAKWFSLVMPVMVLFYREQGLGLQEIFILKGIYSITAVVLEIPSGYLADVWGRRKCLICGCSLFFVGYLCYGFTSSFQAFLLAEILLGMGQTMVNGADSALLYDTAVHSNRKHLYLRYEGRITMVGNFAEAAAGILGGLLAVVSLRFPFYGQAILAFAGIPAALALKEVGPTRQTLRPAAKEIWAVVRHSLVENKTLRYQILFSGIIGAATLTMAWLVQPLLIVLHTPTSWYGLIWSALNLTAGLSALTSHRLDHLLGVKRANLLILLLITAGYVALACHLSWFGLLILFFFYLVRGLATPLLKGSVNRIAFPEMRATVLSVRNVVIRFIFAVVSPFIGWLNDFYSLRVALMVMAVMVFLPGMAVWCLARKGNP